MGPTQRKPKHSQATFSKPELARVEDLVSRSKLADDLARRILAEELVKAQRTTLANSGSTSGDLVKGSAAALRSILKALGDLGLLAPATPRNPLEDLDEDLDEDEPATPAPKKSRATLDDVFADLGDS